MESGETGSSMELSNGSVGGVVKKNVSKDTITTPLQSDYSDRVSFQDLGTPE